MKKEIVRKRIVCRVCGPQSRVFLLDRSSNASWDALEARIDKHEASWSHRRKAFVYIEDAPERSEGR